MRPLEGISKKNDWLLRFSFWRLANTETLSFPPKKCYNIRNHLSVFELFREETVFFLQVFFLNKILKQKPTHWHHITLNFWDLFGEKKPNDTFKACRFCRCSTSASWHRWSWKADLRSWWSLVVGEKTRGFSSSFEGFLKKHRHVQVGNEHK